MNVNKSVEVITINNTSCSYLDKADLRLYIPVCVGSSLYLVQLHIYRLCPCCERGHIRLETTSQILR